MMLCVRNAIYGWSWIAIQHGCQTCRIRFVSKLRIFRAGEAVNLHLKTSVVRLKELRSVVGFDDAEGQNGGEYAVVHLRVFGRMDAPWLIHGSQYSFTAGNSRN